MTFYAGYHADSAPLTGRQSSVIAPLGTACGKADRRRWQSFSATFNSPTPDHSSASATYLQKSQPEVHPRQSILIVEDEGIVALDIRYLVEGFGYRVSGIVGSGEEAVQHVIQMQPDLVLMDVKLSGKMTGIHAAACIKSRFSCPIIFLTAHATHDIVSAIMDCNPDGYIIKPFADNDLRGAIETAFNTRRSETPDTRRNQGKV